MREANGIGAILLLLNFPSSNCTETALEPHWDGTEAAERRPCILLLLCFEIGYGYWF